jgi:cytochrome o ubiquinol oxidase operon protein cyoD
MTDAPYDRAPGEISTTAEAQRLTLSDFGIYTVGLVLAVILTATSFWVANTSLLWAPGVAMGLVVLAIAQMDVHLVFFLHITTGPDNTNNVLALAFGLAHRIPWSLSDRSGSDKSKRQHDAMSGDEFADAALTRRRKLMIAAWEAFCAT